MLRRGRTTQETEGKERTGEYRADTPGEWALLLKGEKLVKLV